LWEDEQGAGSTLNKRNMGVVSDAWRHAQADAIKEKVRGNTAWQDIQKKTFTRWCNEVLFAFSKPRGLGCFPP
jgi:hypothetical protein